MDITQNSLQMDTINRRRIQDIDGSAMKLRVAIVIFFCFVLGNACAVSSSKQNSHTFSENANTTLSHLYRNTNCSDLYEDKEYAGTYCTSSDQQFLTDFGVFNPNEGSSVGPTASTASIEIASGSSTYTANPTLIDQKKLYLAEVDCDIKKESIYRPTATCLVAVSFKENNGFIYARFFLRDNASNKIITTKDKAIDFLREALNNSH